MSIVTIETPVSKVGESDWYFAISELKKDCNHLRENAFQLKNESLKLRNDTDTSTFWATCHTDCQFVDRRSEITKWKTIIELYYKKIQTEIKNMKNDKEETEQIIEFLTLNFSVTNHCLSLREERDALDLCYDSAYIELKNEQYILEHLKSSLKESSQTAWEQINILEELLTNVAEDLYMKNFTTCIDTKLLEMTKDSEDISLKIDPLRNPKGFSTYEDWLQKCNNFKQRVQNEVSRSEKIRDIMYVPRTKTKNDLRSQNDIVNFALRKRIFDTERVKNEMEWQKSNMVADKENLCKEIINLGEALDKKLNCKKLVETRCEERQYRLGAELCLDITTTALHKEYYELEHTTTILTDKLNEIKGMHNVLLEQVNLLEEVLKSKIESLKIDRKCLDYRKILEGR